MEQKILKFRAWFDGKMYPVYNIAFEAGAIRAIGLDQGDRTVRHIAGDQLVEVHLMQFIGLKDRNGREVYEEDLVRAILDDLDGRKEVTERVYYDAEYASYGPFCHLCLCDEDRWINNFIGGFEVIGNIHEHSELAVRQP